MNTAPYPVRLRRVQDWQRAALRCLRVLAVCLVGLAQPAAQRHLPAQRLTADRVSINADAAREVMAFLQALQEGDRWDEQRLRCLASLPGNRIMLAYHHDADAAAAPQAWLTMLMALRDAQSYASDSPRIMRMYLTYKWASNHLPELRDRLLHLTDQSLVERASRSARAALPSGARLTTTVYVTLDGFSPAYMTGDAVVLDVLQLNQPAALDRWLAYRLHQLSADGLLPPPCAMTSADQALATLAFMMQEGARCYFIDHWHARADAQDYDLLGELLADQVKGALTPQAASARLQVLSRTGRGPLQRVGCTIIAELTAQHGRDWVLNRLGKPVALLRAFAANGSWPQARGVVRTLATQAALCPEWFAVEP
ncbi:MAG: DUF5700 domain-containing putative Zn-dependent protease [Anaerolineae bacterium]